MRADLAGLDGAQRVLWPALRATPREFILYGGVALSLRFNHRHSADFDFFLRQSFDPDDLLDTIPYLEGATVLQRAQNTLTCLVQTTDLVKLSFFGLPNLGLAQEPETDEDTGLQIASLLDIGATKASTIQKRAAARDYLDLDLLLTKGGLTLSEVLKAAQTVYGSKFNPQISLKALSFFADGDLDRVPSEVRVRLQRAVREVELGDL